MSKVDEKIPAKRHQHEDKKHKGGKQERNRRRDMKRVGWQSIEAVS